MKNAIHTIQSGLMMFKQWVSAKTQFTFVLKLSFLLLLLFLVCANGFVHTNIHNFGTHIYPRLLL